VHSCCTGLFLVHCSKPLNIISAPNTMMKKDKEMCYVFYTTETMMTRDLKKSNNDLRHLVMCLAVHGFYHK
jgi:hypothetical protein